MKKLIILSFIFIFTFIISKPLPADDFDFNRMEMSFKNFIKCELTRTDAFNHFNGKPFKITMVDLFDIQNESDIKILTGAVECFVVDKNETLYAAVGLKSIMGKEQIAYYTIRKKDFSILATELFKFPYKERCKWSQYWIDID
ncbi:MAG: hypothetical protein GXP56_10040 [Deltaproteobacteria bacterium]|nr:hypothetical protein [Deltaproteobacteria bacterium]